jgi:hypothetical protein
MSYQFRLQFRLVKPLYISNLSDGNIFKSNRPFLCYSMCANHDNIDQGSKGYGNLTPVAWSILTMGLSLAVVILLWVWFGHIGPSFSDQTLAKQQQELRDQYHLPYRPIITDPKVLQTPPSERNLLSNNTSKHTSSRS